jgi:hypothetical protein
MKEIKLNKFKSRSANFGKNMVAFVDDCDFELLNKWNWSVWRCNGSIYARTTDYANGKRTLLMHRIILGIENPKIVIDHKDSNGLNNQRHNIRATTHANNNKNRRINKKGNRVSIYKGVCANGDRFRARITVDKKQIFVGNFQNVVDAAAAYNNAATKYFGEYAKLNSLPSEFKI